MNTQIDNNNLDNTVTDFETPPAPFDAQTTAPGTLLHLPKDESGLSSQDVKDALDKAMRFLLIFPELFGESFDEYRKPLLTVGLILSAGLGIAVADGVLTRLNTIPLFAPTFELIGLGFTGWLVFRYFVYADTRQELLTEYEKIKERILGAVEEE